MESLSKQELISTITKQADQIKRYESRLRDVVAAYKGLAKEKEALETSLKALNKSEKTNEGGVPDDSVAALTESLATLTAEKSRMEEAFQADKKVTREKYENILASMREEAKAMQQQFQLEVNNLKAKIAYEIQERENERADHAAMLKELHQKLNSERKTKEKLEDKVGMSTEAQTSHAELEKRVRDLSSSLEAAQRRLQRAEARTVETPALLVRLQNKLALVEQSHSVAIREEQIKVKRAEESARKICARQEERVALLEGRVAELSATVGEYDARRRRDQQLIQTLQDAMNGRLVGDIGTSVQSASHAELEKRVRDLSSSLEAAQRRLQRAEARTVETPALLVRLQNKLALVEQSHSVAIREEQIKVKRAEESARKICARQEERVALLEGRVAELSATVGEYDARRRRDQQLIQTLQDAMNGRLVGDIGTSVQSEEPQQKSETDNEKLADSEYLQTLIDKIHILKKEVVAENEKLGNPIDLTSIFKMDGYENIHSKCIEEYENLKLEFEKYKAQNVKKEEVGDVKSEIANLMSERTLLKEKLETYGMMLEDERQDKADALKASEEKLKTQQDYHKEIVSDLKTRIQSLEKQVVTQRDRYAALLEETDQYIRARNDRSRKVSVENYKEGHGLLTDVTAPPHMLHYAHELARKDLDITQLRKEKHILEGQYRDHQREATIEKERFKEVIRTLKEEIDRLRRIQSREGANLEYLKNVVMAYLLSTDYDGRRHMLNAIAAVLHFTSSEKNMVLSTL